MASGGQIASLTRYSLHSDDEDEVGEFVRALYVDSQCSLGRVTEPGFYSLEAAEVLGLGADHLRVRLNFDVVTAPFEMFCAFAVHHGQMRVRDGEHDVIFRRGDVGIFSEGRGQEIQMLDAEATVVRIPFSRLDQAAREMGATPGTWQFVGVRPGSDSMKSFWRQAHATFVTSLLTAEAPTRHLLLAEQIARSTALSALHAFPNTALSGRLRGGSTRVQSKALRRAVSFIDDNARLPLTLDEIATAARVGQRALQYGFRRHFDCTPMEYLRRVRLNHAHVDLQKAAPADGDSVRSIAARWGFANPAHFARQYRQTFGYPPSDTLRR